MANRSKPESMKMREKLQAQVTPAFKEKVDQMAESLGTSVSDIIREEMERRMRFGGHPGLPVLGAIPAGPLAEAIVDEAIGYLDPGQTLRWRPGDFFLRVDGDSMENGSWRSESIQDGDYVLIRPGVTSIYGEIAAVRVGSKATLKRLCFHEGDDIAILKPLNPKYEDIRVGASEVQIIGVYRGLVRGDS